MAITVSIEPESNQLTTVQIVRAELGLDETGSIDAILDNMILEASSAIETFCSRKFGKRTITETLPSSINTRLHLKNNPVVTLTSVTYDGTLVDSADYSMPEPTQGWIYNKSYWKNTYGEYLYSVVYEHGFVLPSFTSGTRDLPYDIERACIAVVKNMFLGKDREQDVSSEEIPDVYKVTYGTSSKANRELINPFVANLLLPYKEFKV